MQNDSAIDWTDARKNLENQKSKLIKELDESRDALIIEIKKNNISRLHKINSMFEEYKDIDDKLSSELAQAFKVKLCDICLYRKDILDL